MPYDCFNTCGLHHYFSSPSISSSVSLKNFYHKNVCHLDLFLLGAEYLIFYQLLCYLRPVISKAFHSLGKFPIVLEKLFAIGSPTPEVPPILSGGAPTEIYTWNVSGGNNSREARIKTRFYMKRLWNYARGSEADWSGSHFVFSVSKCSDQIYFKAHLSLVVLKIVLINRSCRNMKLLKQQQFWSS